MANMNEWAKGIGMFLFTSIMFYFFWDNIFLNLINWAGTDMMSTGLASSVLILKTIAWSSFLIVYLAVSPLYLVYCIIAGSRNDVETDPIELLKGIGIWAITMPLAIIILGVMYFLISTLGGATTNIMGASNITFADQIAWIITLLAMIGVTIAPFIYIIKGYGLKSRVKMLEGGGNES